MCAHTAAGLEVMKWENVEGKKKKLKLFVRQAVGRCKWKQSIGWSELCGSLLIYDTAHRDVGAEQLAAITVFMPGLSRNDSLDG